MQTAAQRGPANVRYAIDTAASRFTVQAFAAGLLSALGHNPVIGIRDYDGEIQFVPDTYEKAFVRLSLRLSQLDVLNEMKADDRAKLEQTMYQDVLDVTRFPGAVFESKQVTVRKNGPDLVGARASGELYFHGVTQGISLDARATQTGTLLRLAGEFSIRQSDYGIKPVSFAAGTLRLKDEVKFKFELVARLQE